MQVPLKAVLLSGFPLSCSQIVNDSLIASKSHNISLQTYRFLVFAVTTYPVIMEVFRILWVFTILTCENRLPLSNTVTMVALRLLNDYLDLFFFHIILLSVTASLPRISFYFLISRCILSSQRNITSFQEL